MASVPFGCSGKAQDCSSPARTVNMLRIRDSDRNILAQHVHWAHWLPLLEALKNPLWQAIFLAQATPLVSEWRRNADQQDHEDLTESCSQYHCAMWRLQKKFFREWTLDLVGKAIRQRRLTGRQEQAEITAEDISREVQADNEAPRDVHELIVPCAVAPHRQPRGRWQRRSRMSWRCCGMQYNNVSRVYGTGAPTTWQSP